MKGLKKGYYEFTCKECGRKVTRKKAPGMPRRKTCLICADTVTYFKEVMAFVVT